MSESRSRLRPSVKRWGFLSLALLISLIPLFHCVPPPTLTSVPATIETVQGYASLKTITGEGSARSRFSFVFNPPDKAWIEVTDILQRTLFRVHMAEGKSFLLIPSKKVFWKGREDEIMNHLFGFPLRLEEMTALICGRWDTRGLFLTEADGEWRLNEDASGRIVSGERNNLSFEVQEFIEKSPVARVFVFSSSGAWGRVKILRIDINAPLKPDLFSSAFLSAFTELSWEQILELLNSDR
ncbi:MAG: hypothetical protein KKD56_06795 [Acidobacteria bacterium]|nr:hypothetical protein [Acidobacteriota bacterium]MBU1474471.1 hypothetical protein [Acidobacteriota bacterium]MBU2438524.1 hypothetical protein [Acidobacteriota bacterium]MBU4204312.1 hypothetical protein [Acidobacteriota bacterium]MBU4253548.1 hypothetical protein [Acidobacteriota bacterium]